MPHFYRTVTELDHPGQTDPDDFDSGWRLPADDATVVTPHGKRLKIDANAIIHVPEGVQLTTRWVSWSGRVPPGWVRGPNRRHESNQAETVHKGEQSWAGADLRLDVHVDKPCKVWIEQTAWVWELPD